ncbi:FAD binding domain-containing protein [Evansella sp. AB-P1]|uniref:FAD binding domain-containing protein n=1 Tax=Evansella sp. AB-P1 TaxID=3037653 RepID=UPI00241BEF1F|nr:FAD binding domain-containing protein [Evansella sp. AB-P1]MDG5789554.1 FAD binding domain-containing protein [Evansella sp. AB-P1]
MIPFQFEYYKPTTVKEAVSLYKTLAIRGKEPMYFSGGTEIITLGRLNNIYTEAVIDIKDINDCMVQKFDDKHLYLGAALSLTQIESNDLFPLLSKVSREVADHTARTKITLGGNICGNIFYREAVLPFLLANSTVLIASEDGIKALPINDIFNKELQLDDGEMLIQLVTDKKYLDASHIAIKRRRQWDAGYPVISIAALKIENTIRLAISGLTEYPFRSQQLEQIINNRSITTDSRIQYFIENVPTPILNDTEGSDKYRQFVLKNTLKDIISELEGV